MNGTATMPGSVRRGADFAWRRVRGSGAAGQRGSGAAKIQPGWLLQGMLQV